MKEFITGALTIITILFFGFWILGQYNKHRYYDKIQFANRCRNEGKQPKIIDAYGYKYGILICEWK